MQIKMMMMMIFELGTTDRPICETCHEIETALHTLCECEATAELKFGCLSEHFMDLSDYDEIPLCKILYIIGGTELLMD
jgi:hypothetical protein